MHRSAKVTERDSSIEKSQSPVLCVVLYNTYNGKRSTTHSQYFLNDTKETRWCFLERGLGSMRKNEYEGSVLFQH